MATSVGKEMHHARLKGMLINFRSPGGFDTTDKERFREMWDEKIGMEVAEQHTMTTSLEITNRNNFQRARGKPTLKMDLVDS